MKVVSIVQSQAFRVFRPLGTLGYLPDARDALVKEFGFVDYPKEAFQFFPTTPQQALNFQHGKVVIDQNVIVLDWLQVYPAGISVSTRTNTEEAQAALDHIMTWVGERFKIQFELVKEAGFWSQLNVHFEKPLPDLLPKLKRVADAVSTRHPDLFDFRPQFELTTLHFSYPPKAANLTPIPFRIERAPNVGFDENLYLSDAPLRTQHHIEILTGFETLCLSE